MDAASAPPPKSKVQKLTFWGLAIAPLAGGFTEWAQSNPWPAAALLLVWEACVALIAFWQQVWAKVRPTPVDYLANKLTFWIECRLYGYRKRYLQDVIYQHRNFDVKGLSTQAAFTLELEQVFVDLSVAPMAPHDASADMLRKLPRELQEGRHQVWDFLQAFGRDSSKLVLLGAPGSGKTTLAKHVALTFAHGRTPKKLLKARRNLPILLFLREHAASIAKDRDTRLSEIVARYMEEERQLDVPASWFDAQLRANRCLVMLDGLDEVADPDTRQSVAAWADRQMSIHAGNRFMITSRPHGYRNNPLNGVNVLEIRPLTSEQVENFVHRWYVANEIKAQQRDDPGVRKDARTGAHDLLSQLRGSPTLSDLAVNPLLLTMIATVHRYRGSLPGSRVELYAEICEVSLGKRQQSKGIELDLTPAQKQRVLEQLAWEMMVERKREISADDASDVIQGTLATVKKEIDSKSFLTSIENDSSLLLEKEAGGVYAFAHLTFQEYLAACSAQDNRVQIDVLTRRVADGWWAECIQMFAAIGDAGPVISACIDHRQVDPSPIVHGEKLHDSVTLALALDCAEATKSLAPDVQQELDAVVSKRVNSVDIIERRPILLTFLRRETNSMMKLDDERYISKHFVTRGAYQAFLNEENEYGRDRRPVHWRSWQFSPTELADPVIGISLDDSVEFCNWLTGRLLAGWHFRLPRPNEIQVDGGEQFPWTVEIVNGEYRACWPKKRSQKMQLITKSDDNDFTVAHDMALTRDRIHRGGDDGPCDLDLQDAMDCGIVDEVAHFLELNPRIIEKGDIDLSKAINNSVNSVLVYNHISENYFIESLECFINDLEKNKISRSVLARFFAGTAALSGLSSGGGWTRKQSLLHGRNLAICMAWLVRGAEGRSERMAATSQITNNWQLRQRKDPPSQATRKFDTAALDLHMAAQLVIARLKGDDEPFEVLQVVRESSARTDIS